jgi:hypothetical protein
MRGASTAGLSELALVRDDLVDEIMSHFGSGRCTAAPSSVLGWTVVRGARFRPLDDSEIEGSRLAKCSLLRIAPIGRSLTLVGGVEIADAWLGLASTLPRISAPGSLGVEALAKGRALALRATGDEWSLPATDLDGDVEIKVTFDDQVRHRVVSFVSSPSAESYRVISRPGGWAIEGAARSLSLASLPDQYSITPQVVTDVERISYLGADVGSFLASPSGAAWEVVSFGGTRVVRNLVGLDDAHPTGRSESKRDRRNWRKMLDRATPGDGPPELASALSRVVKITDEALPIVVPSSIAPLVSLPVTKEHRGLARAIGAIAAVSNSRTGLDLKLLKRLLMETLDLDHGNVGPVIRAWQECGLVDELVNVHWSDRRFVAAPPSLEVVATEHGYRATLRGLTLERTRYDLNGTARWKGVEYEELASVSEFVPRSIVLRGDPMEKIHAFAQRHSLPIRYLRPDPFASIIGRDLAGKPPGGYEASGPAVELPGGVFMRRWWRSGAPAYWTVEGSARRTWTHFEESARLWAAAFADRPIVSRSDASRLAYANAYLPLSSARWLSAVGGVLPGPTGPKSHQYAYGSPTAALTEHVLLGLDQFIHSQLGPMTFDLQGAL